MKAARIRLAKGESINAAVKRFAEALVDLAQERASSGARPIAEAVHDFRTATKRLRALLKLLRPRIPPIAYRSEVARLKRAADRLAAARDRAVVMTMLKQFDRDGRALLRSFGRSEKTPVAPPGQQAAALLESARELERTRRTFRQLRLTTRDWNTIEPGVSETYREARRRMKKARKKESDRALHRWRIAVKQLLYQLQWLEPVWPRHLRRLNKHLHELEEQLGEDHDLFVLTEWLDRAGRDAPMRAIKVVRKAAGERRKKLRRACSKLGERLFADRPKQFRTELERHFHEWEKR